MSQIEYLIIDWGTTNFRSFAIDSSGRCIDKIERKMGLLNVADGQFSHVLADTLANWLVDYQQYPIFMAGMIGSANGWVDVGYVETQASISSLAANIHHFTLPWGASAYIVPGVSHREQAGIIDVMRGEEVQVLGLQGLCEHHNFYALLPGTHSKHVAVSHRYISQFSTYMTGEFFSLLVNHSILGKGLPEQVEDRETFERGVFQAQQDRSLLTQIFSARTNLLFKHISPSHVHSFVSGLLIGHELLQVQERVYIVGGEVLTNRYLDACQLLGIDAQIFDGDSCFISGIQMIKESMNEAV
ncbi:2-dehydro-3-deoxygalactonokinase [Vibrio algivorus]|uniref:2-dehydro-3-deoxygalactonokinase n=1 Tax=Vibrio algivorus TaxID=1667024 RepID=A0A557PC26_9VIBR|nr:2-dehydro-3-deoxygalactonokinase [Vibrio algivorus]TVO38215.1 2-dehydro-3-deoxygalactonokinase [Vibrio algivorus]